MRLALVTASFIALVAAPPPANDIDPAIRGVMTRYLRFTATELADMQNGKIVRHSNEASAPGELAVAGGVRVRSTKEAFLDRVRDIAEFKRGPDVLQVGRFSNPPTLQDLAPLTVDKDDFDLRSCRVADCNARLPAEAIRRFEQEINANAPDAQARIAALFKQVLLDHVLAYEKGDTHGRILEYDDDQPPIRPADEFEGVLRGTPAIAALVPGLPDHLRHYPSNRVAKAEDFLYWSKERFGIAPFITATHVTIVCPAAHTCVVTTKDVYSSRYIDASLSISIATDAQIDRESFYLVYASRSRASALKGGFAALRRALAGRRVRSSLEENLKTIKTRLEHSP
jgi:hypothetical protein